jgi:uncharacterized membrane protein SirB2
LGTALRELGLNFRGLDLRIAGAVFGTLLLLTGLVWIGQGLGYIKGSFMTGAMLWFWIGVGCVVIGIVLDGLALFRRRAG